jgi:hypothetical protein
MVEVLRSIEPDPDHVVEIVVHIDESLAEERRRDLVSALEASRDITTAEFCPLRYHLMLVQYNRDTMTSQDVLGMVTAENVHARLIGPV